MLGEANAKADALNSAASDKVAEVSSVNSAAQKEKAGLERGIADIEQQIAETQATLDKTFFLNFGKKGELKDEIKELKAEIATLGKDAAKQAGLVEKASKAEAAAAKASEAAERQVLPGGGGVAAGGE